MDAETLIMWMKLLYPQAMNTGASTAAGTGGLNLLGSSTESSAFSALGAARSEFTVIMSVCNQSTIYRNPRQFVISRITYRNLQTQRPPLPACRRPLRPARPPHRRPPSPRLPRPISPQRPSRPPVRRHPGEHGAGGSDLD